LSSPKWSGRDRSRCRRESAGPRQAPSHSPSVVDVTGLTRTTYDVLLDSGYAVLEAATADQAVQICEQHDGPTPLLLSDGVMPKTSGPQLAARLVGLRPNLLVLYMSGYPDEAIVHHGVLEPGTAFIEKPFTPESLSGKVRRVLDRVDAEAVTAGD